MHPLRCDDQSKILDSALILVWFGLLTSAVYCQVSSSEKTSFVLEIPILVHQPSGKLYVDMQVGQFNQTQSLAIDFNSPLTLFRCQDCKDCSENHMHPKFNMSGPTNTTNSTLAELPFVTTESAGLGWKCSKSHHPKHACGFDMKYGPNSWLEGQVVHLPTRFESKNRELLDEKTSYRKNRLGSTDNAAFVGCIAQEFGEFRTMRFDGILGLGDSSLAVSKVEKGKDLPPDWVSQYWGSDKSANNSFSLCLSSSGGYLAVGRSVKASGTPALDSTSFQYEYHPSEGYRLQILALRVGSKRLPPLKEMQTSEFAKIDPGYPYIKAPAAVFE